MPVFILQAVTKGHDGSHTVHVTSRWPYSADELDQAKAFIDATPTFSGWEVDAFEVVTSGGKLLSKRPYDTYSWEDADHSSSA